MPFLYEFKLNKADLTGVEVGLSTSRKWEEALDEAKLSLPFYESDIPFPQYGLLEIIITLVDNFENQTEIETKTFDMLISSDLVELTSQYGIYRHNITAIEYTAKLDAYIMSSLAKTRSIENSLTAKFELTDYGESFTSSNVAGTKISVYSPFWLPPFKPKQSYYVGETYTFSQVEESYLIPIWNVNNSVYGEYIRVKTIFRIHNIDDETTSVWYYLSDNDVDIVFDKVSNYYIEYGFETDTPFQTIITVGQFPPGPYGIFRFFIKAVNKYEWSVYDVVNSVRQNVSKAGGIESLKYFDDTRIFDIDPEIVDYLKSIQIPQMYLEKATARQMLVFALSYINSLPRLEYGEDLDILKIEQFNLSTGNFEEENTLARSANQNINQIGTRSFLPLNQVLPNNMTEPTVYSPSQSDYQQLRADNLQITDSSFAIKLPKPIYTPKEFVIYLSKITIDADGLISYDITNLEIDLMPRLINVEEWKLKYVTNNFPSITSHELWSGELGLRENMVDNLYWVLGNKKINVSDVYGSLVNVTLFQNVIKLSIYEYLMLNMPEPIITTLVDETTEYMYSDYNINIDMPFIKETDLSTATSYLDLRFRFAYLTDENLLIKNDKEDLSQINFYSEMRQNQDESIINVVRSTRKHYGNLQRTGNKSFSFRKIHYTLSDIYEAGQKDSNGYTITTVNCQYFAYYILADYYVIKHYNRESRRTIVDQTYRWRDNYAKSVLNRHEHYGDYLVLFPPNYNITDYQITKIYSNSYTVRTIMGILLGEPITDTKMRASVALIRTDGMFEVEAETLGNYYGILTPVSAYPVKQGFAFTFGFDSNLVAGDGLVKRGNNWYNQAVRYTNENGRFNYFGFNIYNDYELDSDDYETYPKITRGTISSLIGYTGSGAPYFYCGNITINEKAGEDCLVVDKDTMTNYKQTYQLNVISYYAGLYIIGQAFYNDNFIVNNPENYKGVYLYLYEDDTRYGLFEDLKIKSGYVSSIQLDSTKIEYNSGTNIVSFTDLIDLTNVTCWAIGTEEDLYIACNGNYNGFLIDKEHFRKDVKEIGYKDIYYVTPELETEMLVEMLTNVEISYNKTEFYETELEVEMNVIAEIEYDYGEYIEHNTLLDVELEVDVEINYIKEEFVENNSNLDVDMVTNVEITYQKEEFVENNSNLDIDMVVDVEILAQESELYFDEMATQPSSYDTALTDLCFINSYGSGGFEEWQDVNDYDLGDIIKLNVGYLVKVDSAYYSGASDPIEITVNAGDGQTNNLILAELSNSYNTRYTALTDGTLSTEFVVKVNDSLGGPYYYKSNIQSGSATDKNKYIYYEVKNRLL